VKRIGTLVSIVGLSLLGIGAWAQHEGTPADPAVPPPATEPQPDLACNLSDVNLKKVEDLNADQSLSYFISAADDGVLIISNGNQLRVEGTGQLISLPGSVDPVVTPDARFFTVPDYRVPQEGSPTTETPQPYVDPEVLREHEAIDEPGAVPARAVDPGAGLAFFDLQEAKRQAIAGQAESTRKPVYTDTSFQGSYQSVGTYEKNGKTRYRAINDSNIRDYELGADGSIKPVDSADAPQRLCANRRNRGSTSMQLPMISKDGKHISFYDTATQTTKIFRINENDLSKCDQVLDLGFPTGKVDFNADGSMITFHVDNAGIETGMFSSIYDERSKDVMVMKLQKDAGGEISGIDGYARLTAGHTGGSGTYYPRFRKDGSIVAARDKGSQFALAYFGTENLRYASPWSPKLGARGAPSKAVHAEYALGELWRKACKGRVNSSTQARWMALSLDPESCRLLIEREWETHRTAVIQAAGGVRAMSAETLQAIAKEDLLALCPTGAAGEAARTRVTPPPPRPDQPTGPSEPPPPPPPLANLMRASDYNALVPLFQTHCIECHKPNSGVEGARYLDLENLTTVELQTAAALVEAGVMPKQRDMAADERAKLVELLRKAQQVRQWGSFGW
jgi:hypothetical protein